MAFMIDISGMEVLQKQFEKLQKEAPNAASYALYEGAGVVADAVSREVQGISTEPFKYVKNGQKRKPSPEEKATLQTAPHGVAKFHKKLERIDTTVGYNNAGYANVNWNHMKSTARTNYKAVSFKGHSSNASSYLKALRETEGSEKYGISKTFGRHAQNQKPVGVIANAINSGTSFMERQPFMRKAFTKSKKAAMAAIEERLTKELEKLSLD